MLFQAPERLDSQSEQTPVELPPDVSFQKPLQVSDKDSDTHSEEPRKPMEESQLAPSVGHGGPSPVVSLSTTFENPHVATALVSTYNRCNIHTTGPVHVYKRILIYG